MPRNIVKLQVINGRTYADVVDLIRSIQDVYGNQIETKRLIDRLWELDARGQAYKEK